MGTSSGQVDCIVLSGGGAKGAFGAGAARALHRYERLLEPARRVCFLGTSAGALNAAVLALHGDNGPDMLRALWSNIDARRLLGGTPTRKKLFMRLLWAAANGFAPFHIYDTSALKRLITEVVGTVELKKSRSDINLIIIAANYSRGELTRFYVSPLLDEWIERDAEESRRSGERRKLNRFHKIETTGDLVECLLASAAIPVLFPPVKIGSDWYADGGIGNNTPVQEAALFLRVLNKYSSYTAGDTFCILQDPPGGAANLGSLGLTEIAASSYALAQYLHTRPIVAAWEQINDSVTAHHRNVDEFKRSLDALGMAPEVLAAVKARCDALVRELGGHAPRLELDLLEIAPTGSLGGLLDFDAPERDREGYRAATAKLLDRDRISDGQRDDLLALINTPIDQH